MLAERPAPPARYRLVDTGKVRSSDLCLGADGAWSHPTRIDFTVLGRSVEHYYAVARRSPEISCTTDAKTLAPQA